MRKWIGIGTLIWVCLLTVPAWGNDAAASGTHELNEVFVTATRTEQELDKIGGSSVTIIPADDIDAKNRTVLSGLLEGVPGLDIVTSGGPGTNTTVFLRGAESKNTLILVDGMMINDPSNPNRGANIANLITDGIERVEVVRGPMSVLYGSNATAGVINVITKKGSEKPSAYAGIEGGSYDTWKYFGGVGGALDRFNFFLTGASIQTDGFSAANDENPDIPHAGNTDEEDGWENNSIYGTFGLTVTPDFDISANLLYFDAEVKLDDWNWFAGYAGDRFDTDPVTFLPVASPDGPTKYETDSDYTGGRINAHNFFFQRRLESTLSCYASRTSSDTVDNDGSPWFDYEGAIKEWSWQGGFSLGKSNLVNIGLTYFIEEMDSDSDNIHEDADTKSIWVQDQLFFGDNVVVTAGLRNDHHENFGNHLTYRLAPAYYFNDTVIKASYATGFRSPSLYELYSAFGNEDLDAEESYGWDIGIEQVINAFHFGVTYFALTFDNKIAWDANRIIPGSPFPGGYNQVEGETKTKGVEAFVKYSPAVCLDVTLSYTYTDAEDPKGRLVRIPYNNYHLNTMYRFSDRGSLNLDMFHVGERLAVTGAADKNGNPVQDLDAYTLVNLSAQYDVTDHFQVYGRVDNLFDEFYEEAWSYATPGLSGYAGIKVRY
ncbi:MAG: TonB-dependent receptor [Desulfobacterales bacterium]